MLRNPARYRAINHYATFQKHEQSQVLHGFKVLMYCDSEFKFSDIMKKSIILLISVIISQIGFSQPDCVITFKYIGQVRADSFNVDKVFLPSTAYLVGYEKFVETGGFYSFDLDSMSFSNDFPSHMSSDFCMEPENIVEHVFKNVENYPVRISSQVKDQAGKCVMYESVIPIDQIKFVVTTDKNIEIILPLIDIK